ncbi:hypothetical protein DCAR_0522658 [Daucus carota subsp. sativus]|uniref:ER membrane protein complex subunit 4 n=1 Tax=Daucus carota subsp. sativus TaxID=79200 RepID=A0AAF1B430_DAUCS|nr:hypothetical protein DCAR_0522658 [Daucus carota subsp. sativus]
MEKGKISNWVLIGVVVVFAGGSTIIKEAKPIETIQIHQFWCLKAWKVAQAPSKNLLIMGFMMWVAGSTMHLFSIDITFSVLWQPISVLQGVGKVFEPYKDGRVDLFGPKLLYIALNLPGLFILHYLRQINTLGLFPTHASDWVSSLPPAQCVHLGGCH